MNKEHTNKHKGIRYNKIKCKKSKIKTTKSQEQQPEITKQTNMESNNEISQYRKTKQNSAVQ